MGTSPTTQATKQQTTNDNIAIVDSTEATTIQSSEFTQEFETENSVETDLLIAAANPVEESSLFADEDLKQFLVSTPLFSEETIQQKLK